MSRLYTITGGVYLVLNPAISQFTLLKKLEQALEGGVKVVQIWNNWPHSFTLPDKVNLIKAIETISSAYAVPLVMNEEWELLTHTQLSGVHFDKIPQNYRQISSETGRNFIAGITCSNNLQVVAWAEENKLDYISFCSMFPSVSVNSCEIVRPETIKKARAITQIPFFLSGGITVENIFTLKEFDFAGVAVISGILNTDFPKEASQAYNQALNTLKL